MKHRSLALHGAAALSAGYGWVGLATEVGMMEIDTTFVVQQLTQAAVPSPALKACTPIVADITFGPDFNGETSYRVARIGESHVDFGRFYKVSTMETECL